MGKKNRPPRIPKFKSDPFKSLKGFAVSSDNPPPKEVQAETIPEPLEDLDFASAMQGLGVRKIDAEERVPPREKKTPEEVSAGRGERDSQIFLQALGQMDVTFKDEVPDDGESSPPSARRMKLLRQGKLKVEAELDLHGMERVEARRQTLHFIENSFHQGWRTVRIITGQGHHSSNGPVLRDTIERLLRDEAPRQVLEWGRAPARQGGGGALILFLRSKPSDREGGSE